MSLKKVWPLNKISSLIWGCTVKLQFQGHFKLRVFSLLVIGSFSRRSLLKVIPSEEIIIFCCKRWLQWLNNATYSVQIWNWLESPVCRKNIPEGCRLYFFGLIKVISWLLATKMANTRSWGENSSRKRTIYFTPWRISGQGLQLTA